jgi:hypothetical protein
VEDQNVIDSDMLLVIIDYQKYQLSNISNIISNIYLSRFIFDVILIVD